MSSALLKRPHLAYPALWQVGTGDDREPIRRARFLGYFARNVGGAVLRAVVNQDHSQIARIILRQKRRQCLRYRLTLVTCGHQDTDRRPGLRLCRRLPVVAHRLEIPWACRVQENAEPDQDGDGAEAGESYQERSGGDTIEHDIPGVN